MNSLFLSKPTVVLWLALSTSLQAIDIQSHSAATNDRFADDPSFIGNSYDWSGVGRTLTGGAGKGGHWATLISQNVFISANHYHPSVGATLSFYADNNPASSPVERVITGGQRIGTSDLWVGHFEAAVPTSIKFYNRASDFLTSVTYPLSIYADENALVSGITPTNTGYGIDRRTSMAVGKNVIEDFDDAITIAGTTAPALITIDDLSGDASYLTHEAQLKSGDSGGPMMIESGGELLLTGINWAIGTSDIQPGSNETLRDVSIYSYLGNYDREIQNYIDSNLATPVPEPSSILVFFTGLCVLLTGRKR